MNTPMQELIEQLKELKAYTAVTHGLERSLPYQTAIDYAETMLEQEKETIKAQAQESKQKKAEIAQPQKPKEEKKGQKTSGQSPVKII